MQIIPRKEHDISRDDISENAVKVLYRLKKAGYEAYLVGGGVRDLLLGMHPKDFDVATNASPEQVNKLFRNSRLIGRRFRLVHVVYGRDVIEVATLRGHHDNAEGKQQSKTSDSGMLLRDNVYGTIDEDAVRRDFTINALYYDIKDFSVRSYEGGIQDLKRKNIRLIGDPETRYREDPVRMLRAVRFAAKLNFKIASNTAAPIKELAPLMSNIPAARLFDEVIKLFLAGYAQNTFKLLEEYKLFEQLFPHTQQCLNENDFYRRMINNALVNSDERIAQGKTLTPAFLYAVFLWPCVLETQKTLEAQGMPAAAAYHQATSQVLSNQQAHTSVPRRFTEVIRHIWDSQRRLERRVKKHLESILTHPKFRAAYDFLLLREQTGEELAGAGKWWTQYQKDNAHLIEQAKSQARERRKPRSSDRRPRRRGPAQ
ncbi:polynucleotide adenylyltransferase PcnB [Oceaniserpentilla sp. 4NH20-0058]|uniref:polynucleotide adenylyltransferase PcnB n=1 Tax=Oceaniserpentilla sp. 4NH20-0058 TaxID=3127660 RepID=UPI003109F2C3